jgi:hypothetical protein
VSYNHPVDFEDETDRTAADYHVIPVETPTSFLEAVPEGRSSSVAAFPSSAIVNAVNPSPSPSIPRWSGIAGQFTPNVTDSLLSPDALVSHQKLASLNEAFLLRHFRNSLGAWVLSYCLNLMNHLANYYYLAGRERP